MARLDKVILVDSNDREVGTMNKLDAHLEGRLHRAFSVFIFNSKNELLLQRREISKYHSGGLWSNTCCSHPSPGQVIEAAAKKRLAEEMGIVVELKFAYSFTYQTSFENGLIEHEFDHVFTGFSESNPNINLEEVMDWKWASLDDITEGIRRNPDSFTSWFRITFPDLKNYLSELQDTIGKK